MSNFELAQIVKVLRLNGRTQQIDLGDLVRDRLTGRIGKTVHVSRETIFVRFQEGEKAKYLDRNSVDSVKYLQAQAECIEDDANAAEYRRAVAR